MDKPKLNRIIAREILLFFSAFVLVGMIGGFLFLYNLYYDNKLNNLKQKSNQLSYQIDSLPKDEIKALYEGIIGDLVEQYQVNKDTYPIPKEKEQDFLKDYPQAKHLNSFPNGYSFFKVKSVSVNGQIIKYYNAADLGRKVKKKYSEYNNVPDEQLGHKVLGKYPSNLDSIIVVDYTGLDRFRENCKNNVYRDKLFVAFSDDYDLGSYKEFESKIIEGLRYKNKTLSFRDSLKGERAQTLKSINEVQKSHLNSNTISNILVWTVLILVAILYPLRICYFLIKWSIMTLRQNGV